MNYQGYNEVINNAENLNSLQCVKHGGNDQGPKFIQCVKGNVAIGQEDLGHVKYMILNTCFQFLNNITCIFTLFHSHVFPKKLKIVI